MVISLIYAHTSSSSLPSHLYLAPNTWSLLTTVVLKETIIIAEIITMMAECITMHCVKLWLAYPPELSFLSFFFLFSFVIALFFEIESYITWWSQIYNTAEAILKFLSSCLYLLCARNLNMSLPCLASQEPHYPHFAREESKTQMDFFYYLNPCSKKPKLSYRWSSHFTLNGT